LKFVWFLLLQARMLLEILLQQTVSVVQVRLPYIKSLDPQKQLFLGWRLLGVSHPHSSSTFPLCHVTISPLRFTPSLFVVEVETVQCNTERSVRLSYEEKSKYNIKYNLVIRYM
jgi:hypothetical protein